MVVAVVEADDRQSTKVIPMMIVSIISIDATKLVSTRLIVQDGRARQATATKQIVRKDNQLV